MADIIAEQEKSNVQICAETLKKHGVIFESVYDVDCDTCHGKSECGL